MTQPWGQLVRRDHVLVLGMPGCGKTPFAADLVAEAARVVYYDPTHEWGEAHAVDFASGDDVLEALGDERELAALFGGATLRLAVWPGEETLARDFRSTVEACRAAAPFGGLVLLVDEVGDLAGECSDELRALHRNGHKDGIATVMCSPCANDFPKRCRDTASRVFSFFQKNAADRRALADEYGEDFSNRAATWRHPDPPARWVSPTLHA